jgi:hypothetical protein
VAKRRDWSALPAPPKGSRLHALYERSATYRKRSEAASKGHETRRKHTRDSQRELERIARKKAFRREMGPILSKMMREAQTGQGVYVGLSSEKTHTLWYEKKRQYAEVMGATEYEALLLSLSDDLDVEREMGWDIVY